MLNVLVWHWGREGGSAKLALDLILELRKLPDLNVVLSCSAGSELHIGARDRFPNLLIEPIRTFSGSKRSLLGKVAAAAAMARVPWHSLRFQHMLHRYRIDVALCTHNSIWDMAILPWLMRGRVRYVQIIHEVRLHPGDRYPLRDGVTLRQIAIADGIIIMSKHVQKDIEILRFPPERSWLMPHGAFAFAGAPTKAAVHPRGLRPFSLLFFGRIVAYKGLGRLLVAMHLLQQRMPGAVRLMIAGSGSLEPYQRVLHGLESCVQVENRWIGDDEVGGFLAASDLVVLPYDEASQSGVAASAYTAGRPVVATPIGGLSEQVQHHVTGLLTRDMSNAALAEAIARFIEDPVLFDRCSAAALRHAQEELSWKHSAAIVRSALQTTTDRPRRRTLAMTAPAVPHGYTERARTERDVNSASS